MQQNIETPKTVAEIAENLGVGRRSLERRFLSDLGTTPSKIYLEIRLERALSLLRTTEETVTQIALASGFCDAPHLTRLLRAERGMSPSEFRKSHLRQGTPTGEFAVGVLVPQT
jgi:transcriptional regulator GlxA family with amidase domain